MECKIDYVENVDSKALVHWIELEIDDQVFMMDREDVYELFRIANSVFDRMVDAGESIYHLLYREKVMNKP